MQLVNCCFVGKIARKVKSIWNARNAPEGSQLHKTVLDFCMLPPRAPSAHTFVSHIFGIIYHMALHAPPFLPHNLANSFLSL